ncbi:diphthine--ammonia ligase [Candidatus Woesearchaeota archaeon]|nr:diphthine--ammonia ligase [Candidatus Woesearchaeota archaeon]
MDVAVLYSGGKDSTFALQHAVERGWNIKYLISVKPTRKDCFLFHYATVEQTRDIASMLGIPHFYVKCRVADPVKEADIVKDVVEKNQKRMKVDAVVLGGTGLQETQLKSIQNALRPLKVDSFASHAGEEHDLVMEQMLKSGYEILITQIASDGLKDWLGKKITKENFSQLKKDSVKYGFHIGFEGGYADTLVTDCPLFSKMLIVEDMSVIFEDDYCGHVVINKYRMEDKIRRPEAKRVKKGIFAGFLR